jgi:hypothetical protein
MPAATAAPMDDGAGRDVDQSTEQLRKDDLALRGRSAFGGGKAQAPATPLATPPPLATPYARDLRLAPPPPVAAAAPPPREPADSAAPAPVQEAFRPPARTPPPEKKLGGPGGPYQGQVQTQAQAVQDKDGAATRAKAAPPPSTPAEGAAVAESVVVTGAAQEADARAGAAARNEAPPPAAIGGAVAKGEGGRRHGFAEAAPSDDERQRSPEETAYRRLLTPTPQTRAALRERREAWRAFERRFPAGAHADEARFRVVETGVAAFRAGKDAGDLARAREDAAAYLDRDDASQAARVRALLRDLPPRD